MPVLVSLFIFSSCGTQINSLRKGALNTGASGVPPAVTSLTVTNLSPTNVTPLDLTWGIAIGTYTQYCILENSTTKAACIWKSGALPLTYTDSALDGPLALSVYLKNEFGTSEVITSNSVTIDRTAPELSAVTITNGNPTNTTSFGLSYGVVADPPYADYCIQVNITSVVTCTWNSGILPSTFVVGGVDGVKAISVWLRDSAGNVSARTTSPSIVLDRGVPTVAFSTPAASSYLNATGINAVSVTGTCSENGLNVVISGSVSSTVVCSGGVWSATLNFTAVADGAITLYADHSNAATTPAIQATRSFTKDTVLPTVAVSNPSAGSSINLANQASFAVDGTCSENTRNVVITGNASATVVCSAGVWSANLSFVSAPQGSVTILVNHTDAAGNAATQATRTFTKDTIAPTLAISSPAANSYVNAASVASFAVNGTCSENGQNVVITGGASATVACSAGAWSANLDFSGAAEGTVSIAVNHSDSNGNPATTQNRNFVKETVVPTVAISNPAANSIINASNVSAFAVDGTCSENTRNVVISGAASSTVVCVGGVWSASLDFTAAAQGSVTINVNHTDAAGNPAVQASRSFLKDTVLPTVAISTPAANSGVNAINFATFAVTGTCSEDTRNVVISGDAAATIACSSGTWSTNLDFTSASDGPVTIDVNHTDAAGNNAVQASRTFIKSTGIPTLTIASPAANSYIGSATVSSHTVSGTCSENTRNVVITGSASATVVCTAGAWSANLDFSGAADGVVSIAVNHNDSVGNVAVTQNRNFNKDVVAPTVAISSPVASSYINAASVTAFAVNGTCSENTRNVVISGDASSTVVCSAGAWNANLNFTAAAQGTVTINVNHSDAAGNTAPQASRNFIKDTVLPTVAISGPAVNSSVNTGNVSSFAVNGTCSENTRNVVISGDASSTVVCSAGAWTANLNFTAAAQGTVTIDVNHVDIAGNPATQASRDFFKDTVVPTVAISTPAVNSYINATNVSAYTVAGTCSEDTRNVAITGDATATVTCSAGSWTANLNFSSASEGTVTVYADHTDANGNSAVQATRTYIRDTTPPSMALTSPSGAYRGGDSLNVTLSASDTLSGMSTFTLRYAADGTTFSDVAVLANTATSYAWTIPSADVATAKLRVVGVDVAGNTTTITSTAFTIDSTPPSAPSVTLASGTPTSSTAATLTVASCTDRTKVFVSESPATPAFNAGGWQTCATGAGAITGTLSTGDGTKTLYVFAQDAVGNVSTSNNLSVVLDQTPPAGPAIVFTANSTTTLATTSTSATMTIASCTDRAYVLLNEVGTLPSVGDAGWVACSTVAAANSYTVVGQGTHAVKVWAKDAVGNISPTPTSMSFTYDITVPILSAITLNAGATYTGSPLVTATITATDTYTTVTHIRVVQSNTGTGDCQSEYANNSWQLYTTNGVAQDYNVLVSAGDGVKGVCAWAKDTLGNISTIIVPPTGQPGYASIILEIGNPPVITAFSVSNNTAGGNFGTRTYVTGNQVLISWTITDVEGLDNNPVTLSYTTNGTTWTPIVSNYGGLSGNPTSTTASYTAFNSPAGFFRIKLVAKDKAGNSSQIALSDAQNVAQWSVYAGSTGTRGDDSTALTARLFSHGQQSPFSINKATGDVYAFDDTYGIKKYDAKTGIVSVVIKYGTTNFPTNGAIPANPTLTAEAWDRIRFDSKNRMYVTVWGGGTGVSSFIQQIDFAAGTTRKYIGGGTDIDPNAATSSSINFLSGTAFSFDEDDSMYFLINCTPGTWNVGSSTMKMAKVTQNSDGTPGTLSHVAGNCAFGTPTSGSNAKTQALTSTSYPGFGSIAVWDRGDTIVYKFYNLPIIKILSGISYTTAFTSQNTTHVYNPVDDRLYMGGSDFSLRKCQLNKSGANGDTCTTSVTATGPGACTLDGVDASQACIRISNEPAINSGGTIFFPDGPTLNGDTFYRIRYVDATSKVRTLMGSRPFYGEGLDKKFAQGSFQGIHYKQANDATVFGQGLYFVESFGVVFGKIDPATGVTSVLLGDQSARSPTFTTGTAMSNTLSMGAAYGGGDAKSLAFDASGLPWFRNDSQLNSIDASGNMVRRQTGNSDWSTATTGSNPASRKSYVYGPAFGIALKDSGVFFLGAADLGNGVLAYHDYSSSTGITRLMGGGSISTGYAAPNSTPGSPVGLSVNCGYNNNCATFYSVSEDRLYFSEGNRIRYLTTPSNTATSTYGTIFTNASGYSIHSFIFSMDGTKIFYRTGQGQGLYCHDVSSGAAWCNDTVLGPPSGLSSLQSVRNQFTWKNATTLFMSVGNGEIFEYVLPP